MANGSETAIFLKYGTSAEFETILKLYENALKLKAAEKTKKPEELLKLDNWYQNELPKKIKSRGKDYHLTHEELVQTMKWKQTRGKYYSQLNYLIKVNTPRAVMQETKKAFKKMPNIELAITALSNLKGVGITMASAILAAVSPETAPFMADECLMSIPEIESIGYTSQEYLDFVQHIQNVTNRLNSECHSTTWTPHRVELAIWTHYVISKSKPELLCKGSPNTQFLSENVSANGKVAESNGDLLEASDESNQGPINGKIIANLDDETTTSNTEDSLDKTPMTMTPIVLNEETNDSVVSFENSSNNLSLKRSLDSDCGENSRDYSTDIDDRVPSKKFKNENNGNDEEESSAGSSNVSK